MIRAHRMVPLSGRGKIRRDDDDDDDNCTAGNGKGVKG